MLCQRQVPLTLLLLIVPETVGAGLSFCYFISNSAGFFQSIGIQMVVINPCGTQNCDRLPYSWHSAS